MLWKDIVFGLSLLICACFRVNADIIDLDSDEYEEFITFLNLNPEFLKTASDYELIVFIQEKFEHYRRIQEGF